MVAGWDGLLPGWFSELHPRFKTPIRSLLIVVAACIVFGGLSLVQVGEQEATQLLVGAGMACSGMYYLQMFAVVLWGRLDGERAPVIVAEAPGHCTAMGVTVLSVILQVVPILDVAQPGLFAAKVGGVVILINAAEVSHGCDGAGGRAAT